ncbi:MAG: hypothetical protein Q8R16_03970, partial [bacterium]|nr:hypothetical protein [bacterium]
MSHYAQRFAPWFVPRSMALVVALAAAFFVVLGGVAHAQIRPAERPDFKVTVASFDGVNLHVEYINATGVGYPARRYEVGFRWYASSGEPAGIRHWLPVPEVERGGISILDNRYRTELSYRSGRSVYGRRLAKFIEERPGNATELRITVDDGDRIAEVDEQNNTAVLTVAPLAVEPKPVVKLLPDLAITAFSLGEEASGDMLRIRFKNLGGSTALTRSGDSLIPFWLTWTNVDGQPVAGASSYWFDLRREPLLAGMEGVTTLTPGLGAILVPHGAGREAGRTITQFFADPPAGATHLRAIIDGPNRIEESNETNNTAIIERPALDLVIEKIAHPTTDALTIRYRNRGAINALDRSGRGVTSFWLTWTNVDGKAVVGATRYWVDHRSNTLLRPGEERILTLTSALGAVIVPHGSDLKSGRTLAQFLAAAPESATHLQVVIDGPDTYAESNEQNNVALFPKPMQPKADLRIAEFMIDPVAPRAGERVWFTVRVENVGDTTTGTPTATGLILDNDVASKKLIGQF